MGIDFDLLKRLAETPGIASREDRVRAVAHEALQPLVDEIRIDRLGSLVALKRGKGQKRVMIAAHLDEIGFFVRHIDSNGFLRLQQVGGFDPRTLFAQRVLVHTGKGETLRGVLMPSSKPIHLLGGEKPAAPRLDEFFVDLGFSGDKVKEMIEVGDMVTLDRSVERVGDQIIGKAMDDRVAVLAMIEAIRRVRTHEVDIYAVATVQEEVGLRGAGTAAFGVEPDVGIALDVTLAMDYPGTSETDMITRLNKGVGITIMDSSVISDARLVRQMRTIAERESIAHQLEMLPRGGTDAGAIQRSRAGVPSITLSIPCRYIHTVNEMVGEGDVEATADLLARYLEEAHTLEP